MDQDLEENCFAAALRYYLKNKPNRAMTQAAVAMRVGVSQSYIGQLSRGEKEGKESLRRKIAAVYGYDGSGPGRTYDDFRELGRRVIASREAAGAANSPREGDAPAGSGNNRPQVVELEHRNLIEAFDDKLAAYEINKKLLEIERMDPEEFEKVREYVDFIYTRMSDKKNASNNSE